VTAIRENGRVKLPIRIVACSVLAFGLAAGAQELPAEAADDADREPAVPPAITNAAAWLVCDEPAYSFGERDAASNVVHVYELRNTGNGPVEIRAVRTSCGCTTAQLAVRTLAPGQVTPLAVTFTLKGRRGKQHKTIRVESNDPARPVLRLDLEGTIVTPVTLEPSGVHFESLGRADTAEKTVDVIANSNVTVHVLRVECASTQFSTRLETVEEGRRYRIAVRAEAPRPFGRCATTVDVITDHPQYERIPLPVAALVTPDVMVSPSTLVVSAVMTNRARAQFLIVASPKGKPFKLEKVESPDPRLTVETSALGDGRYQLSVRNEAPVASLDGKELVVVTDVADFKEIRVPIRSLTAAYVAPAGAP
jgi:hypothetical protein